jgi:aryl-alcohol dehydrogenase-like predicted oxidoreductase
VVAIPGASSVEQLESNVVAADIDLTGDQCEALLAASARFRPISGPAAFAQLARAKFGR